MLSKAIVFVFVLLGVWALLVGLIPTDFLTAGFAPTYADMETAASFSMANITMYDNLGADNMTYPYSSYDDGPTPPDWEMGLPAGQYFEVWWSESGGARMLEFRHTTNVWWGRAYVSMDIYGIDDQYVQFRKRIFGDTFGTLTDNWSAEANASVFYTRTPVRSSILLEYNQTAFANWQAAWNAGNISYTLSYEIDWNATGVNAWSLVGQLLTFTAPSLSMTGIGGVILNAVIALPVWSLIAYLVYKIVAGLIPFLSGGGGD